MLKKATILFPVGDYRQALDHYQAAKHLMLYEGLCFHPGIDGLIKSPEFKGQSPNSGISGIVPNEWIDVPEWRTRVEIACLMPSAVDLVQHLPLPAGTELKWEDA